MLTNMIEIGSSLCIFINLLLQDRLHVWIIIKNLLNISIDLSVEYTLIMYYVIST